MDDERIWAFEESLWVGDAENYRRLIDDECVMVLPAEPNVFTAQAAIQAVIDTPRWEKVAFSATKVQRPEEGLIVIAYQAVASRGDEAYKAWCTTTIRRRAHEDWLVVQHSQLPPITAGR